MSTTGILKTVDLDDLGDLLCVVERSFAIKFKDRELLELTTFGRFCDLVTNKIDYIENNDCTSQQAFYKLRKAIAEVQQIDISLITPKTNLSSIFARENRREKFRQLDKLIGFSINGLKPNVWVIGFLFLALFVSFFILFINWKLGVLGILTFYVSLNTSGRLGTELRFETTGLLVEHMVRTNYALVRRNSGTANKREIARKLRELFSENLGIDLSKITAEESFV